MTLKENTKTLQKQILQEEKKKAKIYTTHFNCRVQYFRII